MKIIKCKLSDCSKLVALNQQFIEDGQSDATMSIEQLEKRMENFINSNEYEVIYFLEREEIIGYATIKIVSNPHYLSQFFICREHRNKGLGRLAFEKLLEYFGVDSIDLEVLQQNKEGVLFWENIGFKLRCLYMRYEP
ncbi:MAG: GNAT family N-acetyltransferase [Defluviitaleaceae bacterium]|nr:GNAT family N-acetyltransferase [Defluviitaleaceae bacterium]